MRPTDTAWRLTIRPDASSWPAGAGFVVAPDTALTCAHVVGSALHCWVEPAATPGRGWNCPVSAEPRWDLDTNRWLDVAVIRLPAGPRPVAPLASERRPEPGTVVDVLGYPRGFEIEGQRARARVAGTDVTGRWLQLDGLHAHDGWIAEGFSGAAAVDVSSGRVVGMVAWAATGSPPRIAWMIPLDTIAESWGPLAASLPTALEADSRFVNAVRDLYAGSYREAAAGFRDLAGSYQHCLVYFYWALAGLNGLRPAGHSSDTIGGVERLLKAALWLDPGAAHVAALWAVVKEDYFVHRGLHPGDPPIPELLGRMADADELHVREILEHVPAYQCRTWQTLNSRSRR